MTKKSNKNPIKATTEEIIKEWSFFLEDRYPKEKLKTPFCFICGCEKSNYETIYRHHIFMECDGGNDDPSNLILVCDRCHLIAPTRTENESMVVVFAKLDVLIGIAGVFNYMNENHKFTNKVDLYQFVKFLESNKVVARSNEGV